MWLKKFNISVFKSKLASFIKVANREVEVCIIVRSSRFLLLEDLDQSV